MENQQTQQPSNDDDKKKKILLYGGIALGVGVLGFVGYKLLKKKSAVAPATTATSLSGVRRSRRKSTAKTIELF